MYELTVTDTKGQKNTDEVHVYVRSSKNKAPVAVVEHNATTVKLNEVLVLNGDPSTDDQSVTKYRWKQVRYDELFLVTLKVIHAIAVLHFSIYFC